MLSSTDHRQWPRRWRRVRHVQTPMREIEMISRSRRVCAPLCVSGWRINSESQWCARPVNAMCKEDGKSLLNNTNGERCGVDGHTNGVDARGLRRMQTQTVFGVPIRLIYFACSICYEWSSTVFLFPAFIIFWPTTALFAGPLSYQTRRPAESFRVSPAFTNINNET